MCLILGILVYVAAEEGSESVVYQCMNFGHVDVFAQEWCHRCEETVGKGLFVYAPYDCEQIKVVFVEEARADFCWQLFFKHVAEEEFAEYRT